MKRTTQKLVGSALLAALSVVLARIFGMMPEASARFSIEAVPMFLAGLLYGPVYGALVGFVADFVGCLFSPFGYNPIFCLPPILYGLCAGLFRPLLHRGMAAWKIALAFLPSVLFGSILWQSLALAMTYGKGDTLWESYTIFLTSRSIQFAVTYVIDVVLVAILCRTNVFYRLGYLPKWRKKDAQNR